MVDNYNKKTTQGQGTLVGNWYQERELRDTTGFGRNYPLQHVPKTKQGPAYMRNRDGTDIRVNGLPRQQRFNTYNQQYGQSTNPALQLRKVGKREQMLISQLQQEISHEIRLKQDEKQELQRRHELETTSRSTYGWVASQDPIGKRVMKTQDGQETEAIDEVFAVQNGFRVAKPRRPREILEEEVKRNELTVTLYSDNLQHQIFPISSSKGVNPFAKTSGFTQSIHHTHAAGGFQGNITYK